MPGTIEFFYDLASPNAYLANRALPEVLERTGARVEYRPVLLGGIFKATGNQAPLMAFGHVKAKMDYTMVEMDRFVAKHGLTRFQFNPHFPLNTLMLSRGAVVAHMSGQLEAYIAAGERLVWEQGLKMDDPQVFIAGFTAEGLDGAAIAAKTKDQEVKDRLIANTEEAVRRGAFGVPTFFVEGAMYFGKDRLADVEEALNARAGAAAT